MIRQSHSLCTKEVSLGTRKVKWSILTQPSFIIKLVSIGFVIIIGGGSGSLGFDCLWNCRFTYLDFKLFLLLKEQSTARSRFESLLERIIIKLTPQSIVNESELNQAALKSMFWIPTRILDNPKSTKSFQMRTPLQASSLVNSLKLVRAVMQRLKADENLHHEVEHVHRIDALTMAIWEYNIPISKVK